jgi:plastocyanin
MFAVLFAACGDTTEEDPTPVTTWKITPADGVRTAEPPTPAPTSAPAGTATPGGNAGTTLTIIGASSTFDEEELTAPAGPITIIFDNQDGGVIHNVHFFNGDDADGETVGETELEVGPVEQTIEMDLQAGDYYYQCDAHPTTMSGTLTVS